MKLSFDISNAADAAQAAEVCAAVAERLGGQVPVSRGRPRKSEPVAAESLVAAYNREAAAHGAQPIPPAAAPSQTDPPAAEVIELTPAAAVGAQPIPPAAALLVQPPDGTPRTLAELRSYVQQGCVDRGVEWTRKYVFAEFGTLKLRDMSHEQLADIAARLDAAPALQVVA